MPDDIYPRRFLAATHDVKETWSRALIDEFGPGGLIAEQAPRFQRQHLLWALVLLRHVNGRDGMTFIGDTKVAELLGYNTKDVPGKQAREILTRLGFFTQQGKQGGVPHGCGCRSPWRWKASTRGLPMPSSARL
ncbi:hypothetical protein ACH4UT_20510 [Streptomyces sp. NPDC020799]|uniref:hypothetical protein n=1 Tax=Streptomyces sp. NPDC020799 TaxID=3365091 RepID=UPI00378DB8BC